MSAWTEQIRLKKGVEETPQTHIEPRAYEERPNEKTVQEGKTVGLARLPLDGTQSRRCSHESVEKYEGRGGYA